MSASLSGEFNTQAFTDGGALAAGYRLYTYLPGVPTLKTAYTDQAATTPHTYTADGLGGQYIALNARGELPAPLFLSAGGYDLTLKRPDGTAVWTRRAIGGSDTATDAVDQLRADLADTTDVLKNAALIGYELDVVGAQPRTLKDRLKGERWIEDLIPAGAATHHAYFTAAAALGGTWHVGAGPFTFDPVGGMVGAANFTMVCHGTVINHASSSAIAIQFTNADDWKILGALTIVGMGAGAGTAIGIQRAGGKRITVENVECRNINGRGFYELNGNSLTLPRGERANWINCRAIACVIGREDLASDSTEYNLWVNFTATGCSSYGNVTAAGNNKFLGGNIVDNALGGVWLKGAPANNHLHGNFVGVSINHNGPGSGGFNIRCSDVDNGEAFVGCAVYGDNAGTGLLWIERSKGIMFTGGILDCSIFCDSPTGYSMVSGNFCPDSVNTNGKFGPTGAADPGVTSVIVARNFTRAGMWKYNDPAGPLFVRASRSGNQSIPSATDTTLIFNAESYDTRAAYDNTTGKFTAPWLGNFRVTGSVHLTAASSIPAAGGYLTLKLGGVATFFAPLPAQSATLAIANFVFTAGVAAGTTVEVSMTLTGTTIVLDLGQLTIEEIT